MNHKIIREAPAPPAVKEIELTMSVVELKYIAACVGSMPTVSALKLAKLRVDELNSSLLWSQLTQAELSAQ